MMTSPEKHRRVPFGLPPEEAAKWELSFADEFDGTALDGAKWHAGYRARAGRNGDAPGRRRSATDGGASDARRP